MRAGDGLIYYSPRLSYPDGAPCQRFTAIGVVETGEVYQRDMGGGFVPYRLDVAYRPCREAPIQPLIPRLSFIKDKTRWGGAFRFGHLRVAPGDFALIAKHMGCDLWTLLRSKPWPDVSEDRAYVFRRRKSDGSDGSGEYVPITEFTVEVCREESDPGRGRQTP
jgi:hypothetical protein